MGDFVGRACNYVVMTVSRKCGVCNEWHLLTHEGVMSVHVEASGQRCTGSDGQGKQREPSRLVRGEALRQRTVTWLVKNQPPLSGQRVTCEACSGRVLVTIYGRVAQHEVLEGWRRHRKSEPRRVLCPGSGVAIDHALLSFAVAKTFPRLQRSGAPARASSPVVVVPSQPQFSGQRVVCEVCTYAVLVTVYGRVAEHRLLPEGAVGKRAQAGARRCSGSGAVVERSLLRFDPKVATPSVTWRRAECPRCGGAVRLGSDGRISAHQLPSKRWCSAGIDPTPAERAKTQGKRKRSIWTVSGGLPTHGKR